jgi:hypothetical protein
MPDIEAESKGVRKPPVCEACVEKRLHTQEDWVKHHPDAGHGFNKEQGWSKEGLGRG